MFWQNNKNRVGAFFLRCFWSFFAWFLLGGSKWVKWIAWENGNFGNENEFGTVWCRSYRAWVVIICAVFWDSFSKVLVLVPAFWENKTNRIGPSFSKLPRRLFSWGQVGLELAKEIVVEIFHLWVVTISHDGHDEDCTLEGDVMQSAVFWGGFSKV